MKTEIINGYEIKTLDSGHIISMPVQAEKAQEAKEDSSVDLKTLTDEDFKKIVLEKLGMKVIS